LKKKINSASGAGSAGRSAGSFIPATTNLVAPAIRSSSAGGASIWRVQMGSPSNMNIKRFEGISDQRIKFILLIGVWTSDPSLQAEMLYLLISERTVQPLLVS